MDRHHMQVPNRTLLSLRQIIAFDEVMSRHISSCVVYHFVYQNAEAETKKGQLPEIVGL